MPSLVVPNPYADVYASLVTAPMENRVRQQQISSAKLAETSVPIENAERQANTGFLASETNAKQLETQKNQLILDLFKGLSGNTSNQGQQPSSVSPQGSSYMQGQPQPQSWDQVLTPPAAAPDFSQRYNQALQNQTAGSVLGADLSGPVKQIQNEWWQSLSPELQRIQNNYTEAGKSATPINYAQSVYNPMINELSQAVPPQMRDSQQYKDFLAASEKFKQPPQANMATVINQSSGESAGLGKQLAGLVAGGTLDPKTATNSILNNRFLLPKAKQQELIDLAANTPELGGKYTLPQLQVFVKNSLDPQNNRQATAISALTPNLEKLVQLSDKNGRLDVPALNHLIQIGQFQSGDQTITNMEELQKIVAEEAGRVFGGTATSDFKIKLGGKTVDLSLGQDNFRSNMKILKDALDNKKVALQHSMGPYSPWKDEEKAPGSGAAAGSNRQKYNY